MPEGVVWAPTNSGVHLGAGVRGLNMPKLDHYSSSSPAVAGSRYRGWRSRERDVFWPLSVYNHAGSVEWAEYDAQLWNGFHPDREGTWSVTSPNGESRHLRLRYSDDGDHATDLIPTLTGWQRYTVTLTAHDPYWYASEPVSQSWAQTEAKDFFNGLEKAPLFNIASGSQLDTATMTNPGDVDAWPVWEAAGPFTSVTVGVGGRAVTAPITASAGQVLRIDTDPTTRSATLDGVNVYDQLASWDFAPIPAGESRELSLALAGTGTVKATFTPRFFRAIAGRR